MNMQILHRLARRAGMLSLAALPVIGFVGPSDSGARRSGRLVERRRLGVVCQRLQGKGALPCALYAAAAAATPSRATCATASGKASQTATVYKVSGSAYRGSFVNSQYNVRGSIRVVVHGKSQSVSLSGDGASAQLSLSRR